MRTLRERWIEKVEPTEDGCWLWMGFVDKAGYGRLRLGGRDVPVGYAHRISYELNVGPIPNGLVIDHLCRVRKCCNPAHLEVVTTRENVLRGESASVKIARSGRCKRGHDLTVPDAWVGRKRRCRLCNRLSARAAKRRSQLR